MKKRNWDLENGFRKTDEWNEERSGVAWSLMKTGASPESLG